MNRVQIRLKGAPDAVEAARALIERVLGDHIRIRAATPDRDNPAATLAYGWVQVPAAAPPAPPPAAASDS